MSLAKITLDTDLIGIWVEVDRFRIMPNEDGSYRIELDASETRPGYERWREVKVAELEECREALRAIRQTVNRVIDKPSLFLDERGQEKAS